MDGKIQHLDIDILKRICYVLECSLDDPIEYIPPENHKYKAKRIRQKDPMKAHTPMGIKNITLFLFILPEPLFPFAFTYDMALH